MSASFPPPDAARAEVDAWREGVTVVRGEDAPIEAQLDLLAWVLDTDRAGAVAEVKKRMTGEP